MNAARLSKSERLQRVDRLLSDGKIYTTLDILNKARVANVSAPISELRQQGRVIDCWREGDVWYYRRNRAAEKRQGKVAA